MKTFKQFLKEDKKHLNEAAKIDINNNLFFDSINTGISCMIIHPYDEYPEFRLGQNQYILKDKKYQNEIRAKFLKDEIDAEEADKLMKERIKFLDSVEKDIRKELVKAADKFDNEISKIMKKYGGKIN